MMSPLLVLGADDPEMRRIEEIARSQGIPTIPAMKDGRRVHPGNSYQADMIDSAGPLPLMIMVECETGNPFVHRFDHHRPGDPGYGLPAERYWEASSLGQFHRYPLWRLEDTIGYTTDDLVLAAMDHCPAAAIRGECPGVSAEQVVDRKICEIAKATGVTEEMVRRSIAEAIEDLASAPIVIIGGQQVRDLRSIDRGSAYNVELLSVQTAALAAGETILLRHSDMPGGPEKWSISGHAAPETIEGFKAAWAPTHGLTGIYGVPERGYAGGYRA